MPELCDPVLLAEDFAATVVFHGVHARVGGADDGVNSREFRGASGNADACAGGQSDRSSCENAIA